MLNLPKGIIRVLRYFEEAFSERVWEWAKVLLIGAILAPGERTVTAILRVMGLHHERQFQNYHRVLNRAKWSSRSLSRLLLQLLIQVFVPPDAPIVVGIDEPIERRRGAKIAAKGIYRDPVRSSKEFFVKTSGVRWIAMLLLVPIPWAQRVWALPFFTVLAPSERYNQQHRRRHKKLTDWGRQMIRQLRRWLPGRTLVVVADSSYAVLDLLACAARMIEPVTIVTRLRLDAALYDPAPVRKPGTNGRPRKKGARQSTLAQRLTDPVTAWQRLTVDWYGGTTRTVELASQTAVWYHNGLPPVAIRWVLIRDPQGQFDPQALLCTDQQIQPQAILEWFVLRWQLEVTWHEVRTHLGVETQRQWSDLAISRTTPALLALFSLVTLFAHQLLHGQPLPARQAAWYTKALPTFSDTLAFVRQHVWPVTLSYLSPVKPDMIAIPRALFERFIQTLAFAA
ncbi:MAG TPA: transposase [Ktedonobacteraceae bacterium]|nr:transposase [Ktedonobacteraceae bacterium]